METESYLPNTAATSGGEYFCKLCYEDQLAKTIDDNEVEIAQIVLKPNDFFPMCPIHKEQTIWEKGNIEYEEPDDDLPEPFARYEYECSECKGKVNKNDKVCPYCGAVLDEVVDEDNKIFGFNFGAAFAEPIWLMMHGEYLYALFMASLYGILQTIYELGDDASKVILTVISIAVSIYLGMCGNEIAFEDKGYKNARQFKKGERGWFLAGLMGAVALFGWYYSELKYLLK